jgi:hypothetical protein
MVPSFSGLQWCNVHTEFHKIRSGYIALILMSVVKSGHKYAQLAKRNRIRYGIKSRSNYSSVQNNYTPVSFLNPYD